METSYLKTLELDKIIARAAEGCVCKEAHEMLLALQPQCDPDEVRYALEQTDAINTLLIKNGSPRFGGVENVSQLPEGAEPTDQFHARCAESLMKLFEYMIRMDVTEAACVTHGGVIMSMLSQRAVPTRHPEQWMADPGCGYTVQTDVQLWMRDRLVEAIDIVPFGYADTLRGQAEAEENEAFE